MSGAQNGHTEQADEDSRAGGAQIEPTLTRLSRDSATAGDLDLLDLAQRHLQEAGAEVAEGVGVAGAEEAVVALAVALAGDAGALHRALDRCGDGVAAADKADIAAEDALQHRRHQRIVSAAENQGVDL